MHGRRFCSPRLRANGSCETEVVLVVPLSQHILLPLAEHKVAPEPVARQVAGHLDLLGRLIDRTALSGTICRDAVTELNQIAAVSGRCPPPAAEDKPSRGALR